MFSVIFSIHPPTRLPSPSAQADGGQVAQNMFYTYVLRSKKDGKLYTGWSDNLKSRLKKHNEGKVPATQNRRPFELIYYEACGNKERAIQREKYFKSGFGKKFLRERI